METEILKARIFDTADICERTRKPKFLGFLTKEESVYAQLALKSRNTEYSFFGGYSEAERVMLGCFPEWDEDRVFPVNSVTFIYRKSDKLTHRDFLGSLMALGITRESVGDILSEDGRTVAFVRDDVLNFIISQIYKIGRVGVEVKKGHTLPLPERKAPMRLSSTIASERLDCVVAALCSVSRAAALEKIESGLVSVNSVICEKSTKIISEGDILSVRGNGKFSIKSMGCKTHKNRIVLQYEKYV